MIIIIIFCCFFEGGNSFFRFYRNCEWFLKELGKEEKRGCYLFIIKYFNEYINFNFVVDFNLKNV